MRARGSHQWETTAWHVASELTGKTPRGYPGSPTAETLRLTRNTLARLERAGLIWSRVTKGMEPCRRHSRRKVCVRRRWYSTHVKEA